MSIKVSRTTVTLAFCDACDAVLPISPYGEVDYGELMSQFGYNSPLDNLGECARVVLCEACWRKACAAVGLNPGTLRKPETPALDTGSTNK